MCPFCVYCRTGTPLKLDPVSQPGPQPAQPEQHHPAQHLPMQVDPEAGHSLSLCNRCYASFRLGEAHTCDPGQDEKVSNLQKVISPSAQPSIMFLQILICSANTF